jgi:hypothetical protein
VYLKYAPLIIHRSKKIMKKIFLLVLAGVLIILPRMAFCQVADTTHKLTDSSHKPHAADTAKVAQVVKVDTVRVIVDTIVKKDCYTEYYEIMRGRGARTVTDGTQQVVIALKGNGTCQCFLGKVEVAGGKIKPPLYFRQENDEYRLVTSAGKRLEAAFVGSMTPEELYTIKDGMSIVFRTGDQEYGRLFFFTFVNKGANSNKPAPSAADLMKE